MRTTVTLDPDVYALVRKLMRERDLTFKEAVNQAIRGGLSSKPRRRSFQTPTFDIGPALVPLDKAEAILEAYQRATDIELKGAVMFGNEMIDEASRKMAEQVAARGRAAGLSRQKKLDDFTRVPQI